MNTLLTQIHACAAYAVHQRLQLAVCSLSVLVACWPHLERRLLTSVDAMEHMAIATTPNHVLHLQRTQLVRLGVLDQSGSLGSRDSCRGDIHEVV